MKHVLALVAFSAVAIPTLAHAQPPVAHEETVVHNGKSITVSYEPRIETKLRQTGLGPRSQAACMWESRVLWHRIVNSPNGAPVSGLSRVVSEGKKRSGMRVGHCATMSERDKTRLAGKDALLYSGVVAAASEDASRLQAELASLAALGIGESHAR